MKTTIINDGRYEAKNFRLEEWPEDQRVYDFHWLHAMDYTLTVEQYFSKYLFIHLRGSAGIYSDFDKFSELSNEDSVYKGGAAIGVDSSFGKIFLGVQRATVSGSIRILPIIGYQARFLKKLYIDIYAPQYGYIWFQEENFHMGFGAVVNGDIFNITDDETLTDYKVKYSILTVGPVFKLFPADNLFIDASTGWTIGKNRLEIYDKDDEKFLSYNLNETWFIRCSIGIRTL